MPLYVTVAHRIWHAGVDHVREICGATYIQNVSLSGDWLPHVVGKASVKVRVLHWVPKAEALQVAINDGTWHPLPYAKHHLSIVSRVTDTQVNFDVHQIKLHVSLGQNLRQVDQNKGYNFLNVNVHGLNDPDSSMKLSGLIISDDFSKASKAPEGCEQKSLIKGTLEAHTPFLSYVTLD